MARTPVAVSIEASTTSVSGAGGETGERQIDAISRRPRCAELGRRQHGRVLKGRDPKDPRSNRERIRTGAIGSRRVVPW